jgi:tripartite-type tricarboxylate transporter receptor subunit TctC
MRYRTNSLVAWLTFVVVGSIGAFPERVLSQTPYFQGKTITMLRAGSPGGSGDMQARALIPALRRHIPGQPSIIIENMPGAAGMKAVNHTYAMSKPDGLMVTAVGAGLIPGPILGLAGARYDLDKLIYLGSTDSADPYIFVSRKEAGFDTLEKLRSASGIRIGAQTVGHLIYVSGRLFAYIMGLKDPRLVVGYGGPDLDIALAKGEVDAVSKNAATAVRRAGDGLDRGLFNVHATITIPRGKFHPRFRNVPELDSFAKNERERQLIDLYRAFLYPKWPYILPPGTPTAIVDILRGAMAKAIRDAEFHNEFKRLMGSEAAPLTGEEVETAIRDLPRDPEIIALYKKLADHGPIPDR